MKLCRREGGDSQDCVLAGFFFLDKGATDMINKRRSAFTNENAVCGLSRAAMILRGVASNTSACTWMVVDATPPFGGALRGGKR